MRTYGRIFLGKHPETGIDMKQWVMVETDIDGWNDHVHLTALAQVLLLNLGESPFFSDWGIPAAYSVLSQLFPDIYVAITQQRFSGHFASLFLARLDDPTPHYTITITTHAGVTLNRQVPIPT